MASNSTIVCPNLFASVLTESRFIRESCNLNRSYIKELTSTTFPRQQIDDRDIKFSGTHFEGCTVGAMLSVLETKSF